MTHETYRTIRESVVEIYEKNLQDLMTQQVSAYQNKNYGLFSKLDHEIEYLKDNHELGMDKLRSEVDQPVQKAESPFIIKPVLDLVLT